MDNHYIILKNEEEYVMTEEMLQELLYSSNNIRFSVINDELLIDNRYENLYYYIENIKKLVTILTKCCHKFSGSKEITIFDKKIMESDGITIQYNSKSNSGDELDIYPIFYDNYIDTSIRNHFKMENSGYKIWIHPNKLS
mgnify:CR=1 FL=1